MHRSFWHAWQRVGSVLCLAVLMLACGRGVLLVQAGTITGTAVDISGVNNLAATVDSYSKGNLGKMLGVGLGLAGMLILAGGRMGIGALAAAAGVGMAFVPNMIGTAFDATSAAPLVGATGPGLLTAWWAPATVVLYPVLLAWRVVHDPICLVVLALSLRLRQSRAAA
jgi:hypothetical protein